MTRRPAPGSIAQLPSGSWRVRVSIDGKRVPYTFATREEAEAALLAIRAEIADGVIVAPETLTVGGYGSEWLDRRELFGSKDRDVVKDIDTERSLWRRHVLPSPLASVPLASVRVRDVDDWLTWLRRRKAVYTLRTREGAELHETDRTISSQVQVNALRLLRGCFNDAIRRELLETNPAKLVTVKGRSSRNLDEDWLRAEEIDRLLSCEAIAPQLRTAYACALGLALRQSDLRTLRVTDVDLDAEVPGPHVRVRLGKTDRWHRVPVLAWLEPVLRRHLEGLPKGCPWVFPTRDGGHFAKGYDFEWREKRDRVRDEVRPSALTLAGIERKIRFHDLRGTCATHLALGTWGRQWSLREVQSMLAHSDQRVTERYVRRALDELSRAAAETTGGPKLVTPGHEGSEGTGAKSLESLGGRARDRTADHRCVRPGGGSTIPDTYGPRDQGRDQAAVIRDVLAAASTDRVPRALLEELAGLVLGRREYVLARAILEGGELTTRHALELIALLMGQAAALPEPEEATS